MQLICADDLVFDVLRCLWIFYSTMPAARNFDFSEERNGILALPRVQYVEYEPRITR